MRRRNIRKFQDAYTEAVARHPNVVPDFIGHSNGTYMMGQSLLDVPAMSFNNVVLAGSVLPVNYPWTELLANRRVARVKNERGRVDWPVGWLCSVLNRAFQMKDVGTGGYEGFEGGGVVQEKFHPGPNGHGAMFNDENIPRMVRFALGADPGPELPSQQSELAWWSRMSRLLPWIVPLLLAAVCGSFWFYFGWPWLLGGLVVVYVILDII